MTRNGQMTKNRAKDRKWANDRKWAHDNWAIDNINNNIVAYEK